MAKTIKHDIYNVLDEDGNVIQTLRYPEGSSLYNEAKKARESGDLYEVYESSNYDSEKWAPASSAKVNISLDPVRGKVTLTGPSWLTNEVKNSDAFKQTYLENGALNSLLKTYRADPYASISLKDGTTMTVSEALSQYEASGNDYFTNFANNVVLRDQIKAKFGMELNDKQLSVATSGQKKNSAGYNKDAAIKIPKDKNIRELLSYAGLTWDPETDEARAEDFFNTVYKIDQDGEIQNIYEIREYIDSYLVDAMAKNVYDRSDEEVSKIREQQFSNEEYKDDLAAMLALRDYVNDNKPESVGRYEVYSFVAGLQMKFAEDISNAGQNMTVGTIELLEKNASLGGILETESLGSTAFMVLPATLFAGTSLSFSSAVVLGTMTAMIEQAEPNPLKVYENFLDEVKEIADRDYSGNLDAVKASEALKSLHQEAHAQLAEVNTSLELAAGDPYAAGEFFGNMAYKIVENVVLLNAFGAASGKTAVDIAKCIPGLAQFITTFAPKAAPALINFVANVGTQAIFETYIDDKDLIDDSIAAGGLTEEAWDKLRENFLWNAVGEGTGKVGDSAKAAFTRTTVGKQFDMAFTKFLNKIKIGPEKLKYKFFSWFLKEETDSGGGIKPATKVQATAQYMTEYYGAKLKAMKALSDIPIVKEMTEAEKLAVKDGTAYILTGKTLEEATKSEDDAVKTIKEIFEKADKLKAGTEQNYEYFQKAVFNRLNLENNLDAIIRGDKAKLAEMNAHAGEAYDNFSTSMAKTLEMEQRVQKVTGNLTPRESGAFFTKESSEYMSYQSQIGRYRRLTGEDGGEAVLTGKSLKDAKEYLAFMEKRVGELKELLGKDLAGQLDVFRHAAHKYYAALQDYMIKKGYVTKEYADLVKKLRDAKYGWGEDGIEYIPTMRTVGEADINYNINKFLDSISPDNMRSGKTIADELKMYKMGSADGFMDPAMVIYAHSKMMAQVAQGQDMWRALQGNNIMARAVKNFDANGVPEYEKNLIQKSANTLRGQIRTTLSAKGSDFSQLVRETISGSTAYKNAVESKMAAGARSAAGERLDKHITVAFKTNVTNDLTDGEITGILGLAPKDMEIPNFSLDGINAAGFKDWYDALPKEAQATLNARLGGQKLNITNVRKVLKDYPDTQTAMKKAFVNSKDGRKVWDSPEAKRFLRNRAAMEFKNSGNTVMKEDAERYLKACENVTKGSFKVTDPKTFNADFSADMKEIAHDLLYGKEAQKGIIAILKESGDTSETFRHMVKNLTDSGVVSEEQAELYCALLLMKDIKSDQISSILRSSGGKDKSIERQMLGKAIKGGITEGDEQLTVAISRGVRSEMTSMFNQTQRALKDAGVSDLMDLDTYWKTAELYRENLLKENSAYKYLNAEQEIMDRHIVKAVGKDNQMHYYVTDPNTAFLVNNRPTYTRGGSTKAGDFIGTINDEINQVFRAGTTGFDRTSYINQWFRDSLNAAIMGASLPFTDLKVGLSGVAAFLSDYIPFGQRFFGKFVTERVSTEVVNATYEAARKGLIAENGDAFVKSIEERAVGELTGEAATEAKKRAVVEYSIQRSGYEVLPSGNIREAETYRVTGAKTSKTLQEARQEEFDTAAAKARKQSDFVAASSKMKRKIDDIFSEDISKGQWRETFLRKAVYTSQYKNAIKAGNSDIEARAWATRYAMDATTNFGRPFPIGNNFLRHVPYLGAALNGSRSFWRLMELDPTGVMSRLTMGLILPYTTALTESLSDPANLEAYKNIPEYEKDDKMVLMYHGAKVTIPCPQELSGFLAPFRHVVEKAAGANDNSWVDLVASDTLGILPLDLSGFVELDANDFLAEGDSPTPFWSRVGRGFEKAASTLMPPVVKSVYMGLSGKDPYTGRDIDTSYKTIDDEGNEVIMDSNQSEIAQAMKACPWFKDVSASAVQKILATLMGRSTLTVLDGAAEIFMGAVDNTGKYSRVSVGEWFANRADEAGEQLLKPVGASNPVYDPAYTEWRRTVSKLYDMRSNLVNDEGFAAAYRTLQSKGASDEKREGALGVYKDKLDTYEKAVLDAAKALKQKYPDAYTPDNQAQIVSLLSLPTGLTYSETAYGQQTRDEAYYDARDQAVSTYVRMGFPEDYAGETLLGRGYFDNNGAYQFKIYTPYEIQFINSGVFGEAKEFQAQIDQAMDAANIKSADMWNLYYSASSKAERKELMSQWNKKVAPIIYPIVQKYGVEAVLGNGDTRDKVSKYIYVSNPYKKKEYLYELFGGND